MIRTALAAAVIVATTAAASAQQWICTTSESAGVLFHDDSWGSVTYSGGNHNWLVAPPPEGSEAASFDFLVTYVGQQFPAFYCNDSGGVVLRCGTTTYSFTLHREHLRFAISDTADFIHGEDIIEDSLVRFPAVRVAIGECTAF